MPIWDYFHAQPALWIGFAALLGATVGSFLNVVIYRLPKMMDTAWRVHCADIAGKPAPVSEPAYNLAVPRSQCPHCGHTLSAFELVPVLSYVWQRGRCRQCDAKISVRYPAVEVLTALLTALTAWHFGAGFPALAALAATWCLIALSFIDLDHHLLPDGITLPLLWGGLLLSVSGGPLSSSAAILGAAVGYGVLWLVYWGYKLTTGKEGMGYGDFKLLAALGAWLGWQAVPIVLMLASIAGAVIGIGLMVAQGRDRHMAIPFGPYLAVAGWVYLIWGNTLIETYLRFSGLSG
ncbi:MAG: A24 family peptidase [Gammaproteobacteria bacterium]|nr:A24 family peptidase [Gammaproteobacteria bacterium]